VKKENVMWKLWREHNGYIQGELISKHASDKAALKKAKTVIEYKYQVREEDTNEIVIWLEDEDKIPIGIVTHKKGTKRIRQDKKEK
jgi:hypothetical protein